MKFKGHSIERWQGPYNETPDKGEPRYYIQTHHRGTGLPYRSDLCPRAWSLREAKEKINEMVNHE